MNKVHFSKMRRAQCEQRPPRVSVIICCYRDDRFDLLLAAADSVAKQTLSDHELIIVVDHNDSLEERIRACRPEIRVVQSQEPKGLSGARNAGLKNAHAEIVAFLDDDATAPTDWLERLLEPYSDDRVVGVGGSAIPAWESKRPSWLPVEFYWVIGCSWIGLPAVPSTTRNLIGCNMSFRRDACLHAGGFAGAFFFADRAIVNDETEFCVRLARGSPVNRLIYLPDVAVRHYVPGERQSFSFFAKRCWREGRAKRITTSLVGSSVGLARERAHLTRVIPRAIRREMRSGIRGDPTAVIRGSVVLLGTLITVLAFLLPRHT